VSSGGGGEQKIRENNDAINKSVSVVGMLDIEGIL
jgi:hypothetical protein